MKVSPIPIIFLTLLTLSLPACNKLDAEQSQKGKHEAGEHEEEQHEESHKILVTSPFVQDVISTQRYVCQIHSCQHIEVRALEGGYLEKILVKEGQSVKQGELMFKILPVLLQAKLDADMAEAQLAEIELKKTEYLLKTNVVSDQQVALAKAKLAKAKAQVDLARAELNFTDVKVPFDGIVDRQLNQQGSLIEEGDILTTFSDNRVMWVYFNVPEASYLEYKAELDKNQDQQEGLKIELLLADGNIFPEHGTIGAIEADFNNETGNIAFRADFPNPDSLLRNGQTGTILIHTELHDALVIPERATFEILDKVYVYVVDEHDMVHQREVSYQQDQDDLYVIKSGLDVNDRFVLDGIRQVRDGDEVECEFRAPEEVLSHLKYRAE